jgi:hypothetical protein
VYPSDPGSPHAPLGVVDEGDLLERPTVSASFEWLKHDGLLDADNLTDADVIALEIAEELRVALGQIEEILGELGEVA